jgi:hypothetical protein
MTDEEMRVLITKARRIATVDEVAPVLHDLDAKALGSSTPR